MLTCSFTLVTLTHASWRVPTSPQSIFTNQDRPWPSTIPQFILDTDHPWLTNNTNWLSRYPSVRAAIRCEHSDLWTNPNTPKRALPLDLLAKINIDNNKDSISRLGWKSAAERSQELKECPAALEDAKVLHLDVYVHVSQFDTSTESTLPPQELPDLFAQVLSSMSNLEKLHWGVTAKSTHLFEAAFAEANVTLPSVKELIPAAYNEWLARRCPNLEAISGCEYSRSDRTLN